MQGNEFLKGIKEEFKKNQDAYGDGSQEQEPAGTLGKIAGAFVGKGTVEDWNNGRKLTAAGKAFGVLAAAVTLGVIGGLVLAPLGPIGIAVGVLGGITMGAKGAQKFDGVGKTRNERTLKTIDKSIKGALDQFPEKKQALEKEIETAIKPHEQAKEEADKNKKMYGALFAVAIVLAVLFPPAALAAGAIAAGAGIMGLKSAYSSYKAGQDIKSARENTTNKFLGRQGNEEIMGQAAEILRDKATDRQYEKIAQKSVNKDSLLNVRSDLSEEARKAAVMYALGFSTHKNTAERTLLFAQQKGQGVEGGRVEGVRGRGGGKKVKGGGKRGRG